MIDIYPMFKLCVLFREKQNDWQREDLDPRIIHNYPHDCQWTDENLIMERESRIINGEAKSVSKYRLVNEYIKRYYPEHTKLSDAFGALVEIDRSKSNADCLKADVKQIIDNCIDERYGYLDVNEEHPERVYLNSEGRDFASPPFLRIPFTKFDINIGLIKGYLKAIGQAWSIVSTILLVS